MRSAGSHRHARHTGRRLGAAAGVAAALHLGMALLSPTLLRAPRPEPARTPDIADGEQAPLDQPREETIDPASIAEIVLPEDLPPMVPGQLVPSTGAGGPPADTPYIAEHDSNPDRQTRRPEPTLEVEVQPAARRLGGTEGPAGEASEGEPAAAPRAAPTTSPQDPSRTAQVEGHVLPEPADEAESVPALSAPTETTDTRAAMELSTVPALASPPGATEQPGVTTAILPPAAGGDSDDDLPELPVGEATAVAARRSAMAGLLNSVGDRVRNHWRAREIYPRLDPTGRFGDSSLITTVNVRLGADGRIERAHVVRGSGLGPMDLEAVAAFARADPFIPPPGAVLDGEGGVEFDMDMEFEVRVHRFRVRVRQTLAELWRPSPAFQRNGDHERVTIARVLLTADGVLTRASVIGSAGIDFLDRGVIEALRAGVRLPHPPDAYGRVAGLVPLWIEFHHNVRSTSLIKVLSPSERPRLPRTQAD
jgi:TonB family protein